MPERVTRMCERPVWGIEPLAGGGSHQGLPSGTVVLPNLGPKQLDLRESQQGASGPRIHFANEAPNQLLMKCELAKRDSLLKFRARNKARHMCVAAKRLHAAGLPWEQAFMIIRDAFDAAVGE